MLAGVIVLTAQSAALARTMPDASGQMVICTGTGPMVVLFDENGDPLETPQICPDCVMSLLAALDTDNFGFAPLGRWGLQQEHAGQSLRRHMRLGTPNARAPPRSM